MDELRFNIHHADGRHETTTARAMRILIGSGAHCDVRLPADQAPFEHVAIEQHGHARVVRAVAAGAQTTLGNTSLVLGAAAIPLAPTVRLSIGATQIQITGVVAAVGAKGAGVSPVMIAKLLVIALLIGAIAFVSRASNEEPLVAPPGMPRLFADASAECPRKDLGEARAVAIDHRAKGDGARERSPFDPREARSAIQSYDIAAACYRAAGLAEASADAAETAKRMRAETLLDFRARRARLDRLLFVQDYELASQDVTVLRALTEGQEGDYVRFLSGVAQHIKNQKAESAK